MCVCVCVCVCMHVCMRVCMCVCLFMYVCMCMQEVMPSVHSLRQQGVTFANSFVTTPVCCPSRSSIFSGRYQHNTRCLRNSIKVVCVYGCMGVWVYGCMCVWLCVYGCMGVCVYGCMGVWVHGRDYACVIQSRAAVRRRGGNKTLSAIAPSRSSCKGRAGGRFTVWVYGCMCTRLMYHNTLPIRLPPTYQQEVNI